MLLLRLYNREVTFLFGYVTVNGNVYSSDSDAAALSEDFSESSVSAASSASSLSVSSVADCSPVCSQDWKSSAGS